MFRRGNPFSFSENTPACRACPDPTPSTLARGSLVLPFREEGASVRSGKVGRGAGFTPKMYRPIHAQFGRNRALGEDVLNGMRPRTDRSFNE